MGSFKNYDNKKYKIVLFFYSASELITFRDKDKN